MRYVKKCSHKPYVLSVLSSVFFLSFLFVSKQVAAQCNLGIFINEFHYDNVNVDIDEFVEVAVPNMVLSNPNILSIVRVTLYDGSTGEATTSEIVSNFQMGMTDVAYTYFVWKPFNIEDGAPDGISLSFDGLNPELCELISYEGVFTATNGPAAGTMSMDIGVAELGGDPPGLSLQKINGVWVGPIPQTAGMTNAQINTPSVVMISEIAVCNRLIELQNVGFTTVDISSWRLCNWPLYDPVSNAQLISGSLNLGPGDFVTVRWGGLDDMDGELGLYLPTGGFGDPDNIVDYVQYNSINNVRSQTAVDADVWDDPTLDVTADTSNGCMSIIANASNPSSANSTSWCTSQMNTIMPAGANSACISLMCGITSLGPVDINCNNSTPGIDMVTIEVVYTGMDPNAVLNLTVNGSPVSNIGSDPTSVMNGSIIFMAAEGDSYSVTFDDLPCMGLSESGTIPVDLCLTCITAGDLVINEFMQDPDAVTDGFGEYFEVYNTSSSAIDLLGLVIQDDGSDSHAISMSVLIPAGSHAVLSNNADMTTNGGLSVDYEYTGFTLDNAVDEIIIICGATEIDRVNYDGTFPLGTGISVGFDPLLLDGSNDDVENDLGSNWCQSTSSYGSGDKGTPSMDNDSCVPMCGISFLGIPDIVCTDFTANPDVVKVFVNYGGVDPNAVLSITVNGSPVLNQGDDPTSISNGTIAFNALEGDSFIVKFTDPICDGLVQTGTISLTLCQGPSLCTDNLYINGVIDGPLFNGTPKAVQFCANADIPNLSVFGVESVPDGSGTVGIEYNFPPDPLEAGECIWVASEVDFFTAWFGFAPCYVDNVVIVDGDDAIMLYCGIEIIDQLGDPDCDPNTGLIDCGIWEYMDGWVFATDNVANPIFDDSEWEYSMENALDNELTNATAVRPYPLPGTMCPDLLYPVVSPCPDDYANGGLPNSAPPLTGLQDVDADYETDGDIISDQIIGSIDPDIMVDYDSGTMITLKEGFEVSLGVRFHAFIDGCGGM